MTKSFLYISAIKIVTVHFVDQGVLIIIPADLKDQESPSRTIEKYKVRHYIKKTFRIDI